MDLGKDKRLGDYLLGKLPEEEEARLETDYLADAELREQVEAVEAELIDAYLKDELSRSERRALETRFLASPRGQERLRFARTWMGSVARERPSSGGAPWLMAAAALVAVGLLAALAWMSMPRERGRQVAGNDRAAATEPSPAGSATSGPPDGPPAERLPREHWNDLYAGISRGMSGANEVRIDATSPEAKLALNLDSDNHEAYDVVLLDTDWRQKGVRSERTAAGPLLRVKIPAARLAAGKEYTLVVSPASSPERPIRAYVFRVERRPPE